MRERRRREEGRRGGMGRRKKEEERGRDGRGREDIGRRILSPGNSL